MCQNCANMTFYTFIPPFANQLFTNLITFSLLQKRVIKFILFLVKKINPMTSYNTSSCSDSFSSTTSPSSTSSQTSPPTKPAAAAAAAAHQPPSSCHVCSGPTTGIWHYGAECCRACASFFHRSIKANRKYVCRAGQNCLINNGE
jgi:hypothetical protein